MFRFHSCKFKIEKSKLRAARVVLFKEYGIMNCFTLEASFHGYIDKDRTTTELTIDHLEEMGKHLGLGFLEYTDLIDEDARGKFLLKQSFKGKKRKMKACDIAKAILSKQETKELENRSSQGGLCSDTENDTKYSTQRAMRVVSANAKGIRSSSTNNVPSSRRSSANLLSDTAATTTSDENTSGIKATVTRSKSLKTEESARHPQTKPNNENIL